MTTAQDSSTIYFAWPKLQSMQYVVCQFCFPLPSCLPGSLLVPRAYKRYIRIYALGITDAV